jgi:hypothetical protein
MADEHPNLHVLLAHHVLLQLAQEGVPEDVLDLLTEGDPEVKVSPGALRRALVKALWTMMQPPP